MQVGQRGLCSFPPHLPPAALRLWRLFAACSTFVISTYLFYGLFSLQVMIKQLTAAPAAAHMSGRRRKGAKRAVRGAVATSGASIT